MLYVFFSFRHLQTPMNQASTRSHCIFTVHVCRREPGSATLRQSKLHLVDLAGSDRVSKTGLDGQLLTEAKYINLSLHYLEQVNTYFFNITNNTQHVFLPFQFECVYFIINSCDIKRKRLFVKTFAGFKCLFVFSLKSKSKQV